MYRLVNVPVKPAGRFGATETDPGPSGVGDEFITIPFSYVVLPTIAHREGTSPP